MLTTLLLRSRAAHIFGFEHRATLSPCTSRYDPPPAPSGRAQQVRHEHRYYELLQRDDAVTVHWQVLIGPTKKVFQSLPEQLR